MALCIESSFWFFFVTMVRLEYWMDGLMVVIIACVKGTIELNQEIVSHFLVDVTYVGYCSLEGLV